MRVVASAVESGGRDDDDDDDGDDDGGETRTQEMEGFVAAAAGDAGDTSAAQWSP